MQTHIELTLRRGLDEQIVADLVEFFEPVATPQICEEEEAAAKAWHPAVVIALTIPGEWVACR
jgi:hypothetical protein